MNSRNKIMNLSQKIIPRVNKQFLEARLIHKQKMGKLSLVLIKKF